VAGKFNFSAPGNYRIEIQGQLLPDWCDRLGAMQVISSPPEVAGGITILQGRVADQAELSGILNTLCDLQLSLLSLHYLGDKQSSADGLS
jgi:hypothetical protein